MVAGTHADVDAWLAKEQLPPRPAALAAGSGSAQVWMVNGPVEKTADKPADKDAASVILVVSARDAKSVSELLRPLPHYGQQSFVVFDGAHAVARGVWPPEAQGWRRGG
jgi:aminopeptidase N